MRAAVMRNRALVVAEVAAPKPGAGEVLVRTLACGMNPFVMDLGRDVVMGHEFCAEIVEHGPETTKALKAGTRVCSRPTLLRSTGPQGIGYSNDNPGTPDEFAATLRHIAEGALPAAPLITGHVGLDGVAQAFVDLGFPERHAKILVHPGR